MGKSLNIILLVILIAIMRLDASSFNDISKLSSSRPKLHKDENDDSKPQISRPRKTVGLLKKEKEQLYEAYNLLHSLAQVC